MRFLELSRKECANLPFLAQRCCVTAAKTCHRSWSQSADSQRGRNRCPGCKNTPMDIRDFDFPATSKTGASANRVAQRPEGIGLVAPQTKAQIPGHTGGVIKPLRVVGLYFFDEIDNGITPQQAVAASSTLSCSRPLRAISRSSLLLTSPALLAWMSEIERNIHPATGEYWSDSVIRSK